MKIEEIEKQLETMSIIEYEGKCHDCGKDVKVRIFRDKETGAIVIEGGAVYNPLIQATTRRPERIPIFVKCNRCHLDDNVLRNYQDTDVYSRVVGYLRPVGGWNKGKIEEFKQRKEFVVEKIGGNKNGITNA